MLTVCSVLVSRSSGLGLSPGQGHCIVFLGKKTHSHSVHLCPGVENIRNWPDRPLGMFCLLHARNSL